MAADGDDKQQIGETLSVRTLGRTQERLDLRQGVVQEVGVAVAAGEEALDGIRPTIACVRAAETTGDPIDLRTHAPDKKIGIDLQQGFGQADRSSQSQTLESTETRTAAGQRHR